ncbi:hypothetical protein Leryth_023769 [Lithospermum erythrorhizon]|nr:hypothetical protein Leryth_023769 [Lithospermum erythrorhizon]
MERKRKVSLFDVVDEGSKKINGSGATNGGGANALSPLINPWNLRPYSQRYYEILEKRKTLPVWQQKEDFFQVLKSNQTLILVGETGSGKTTQNQQLIMILKKGAHNDFGLYCNNLIMVTYDEKAINNLRVHVGSANPKSDDVQIPQFVLEAVELESL